MIAERARAVLFDKDGTLFDFFATFGPALCVVLTDLAAGDRDLLRQMSAYSGFDLETKTIAPHSVVISDSTDHFGRALAQMIGIEFDRSFAARIDRLFQDHSRRHLAPFKSTRSVLDHLSNAGYPLGLATNDSESGARDHLQVSGFDPFFAFVAGYDSGHGSKPEPGQVSAFADFLGIDAGSVVMVGDSSHDLIAAKAAGALAIGVTTGAMGPDDLAPHADAIISRLDELPSLLGTQAD